MIEAFDKQTLEPVSIDTIKETIAKDGIWQGLSFEYRMGCYFVYTIEKKLTGKFDVTVDLFGTVLKGIDLWDIDQTLFVLKQLNSCMLAIINRRGEDPQVLK